MSAGKCPSPLKNRDFVTLRSWLPLGNDYMIINYSVKHPVSPRPAPALTGVMSTWASRHRQGWAAAWACSEVHGISLQKYPPRKDFVRAVSLQTGYLIKANGASGCILYYLTQVDPRGECQQEGRVKCASSGMGPIVPLELAHRGFPSPGGPKGTGKWGQPREERGPLPGHSVGQVPSALGGDQSGTGHCRLMVPLLGLAQIG